MSGPAVAWPDGLWFVVDIFDFRQGQGGLPEMIRAQSHFLTLCCTSFQPFSSCEQPLGTKTIHNLRYSTSENYVLFYFGTGSHFQLNECFVGEYRRVKF